MFDATVAVSAVIFLLSIFMFHLIASVNYLSFVLSKNTKLNPINHPICKEVLKRLEFLLSYIDSRFTDLSLCGSSFQGISYKQATSLSNYVLESFSRNDTIVPRVSSDVVKNSTSTPDSVLSDMLISSLILNKVRDWIWVYQWLTMVMQSGISLCLL